MKNEESDGKLSHPILFYLNKFFMHFGVHDQMNGKLLEFVALSVHWVWKFHKCISQGDFY